MLVRNGKEKVEADDESPSPSSSPSPHAQAVASATAMANSRNNSPPFRYRLPQFNHRSKDGLQSMHDGRDDSSLHQSSTSISIATPATHHNHHHAAAPATTATATPSTPSKFHFRGRKRWTILIFFLIAAAYISISASFKPKPIPLYSEEQLSSLYSFDVDNDNADSNEVLGDLRSKLLETQLASRKFGTEEIGFGGQSPPMQVFTAAGPLTENIIIENLPPSIATDAKQETKPTESSPAVAPASASTTVAAVDVDEPAPIKLSSNSMVDLAAALSYDLPLAKSSAIDSEDALASVTTALAHGLNLPHTPFQPSSSRFSSILYGIFTQAQCNKNGKSKYLVFSCSSPKYFRPDNAKHHLTPLLDLVRAVTLAISSRRTLIIDQSNCNAADTGSGSCNSCCLLTKFFKPISRCILDFDNLPTQAAKDAVTKRIEVGMSGSSSALMDPYSKVPYAFFHPTGSCHLGNPLWESIPGSIRGEPISRMQIVRIITSFLTQPVPAYVEQIKALQPALLEQLQLQLLTNGFEELDSSIVEKGTMPPYISTYIPLSFTQLNSSVAKLQTMHLPKRSYLETSSHVITEPKRAGIRASTESPLAEPFLAKAFSRYYSLESYVEAIRNEASNRGLKIVVVWSHDHGENVNYFGKPNAGHSGQTSSTIEEREKELKNSPWISRSPIIEEVRERLPHLIVLDAMQISSAVNRKLTSSLPFFNSITESQKQFLPYLVNSLNNLFLISSANYAVGSYSAHVSRLMTYLIPSAPVLVTVPSTASAAATTSDGAAPTEASATASAEASSHSVIMSNTPFHNLDSDSWYLGCWDMVFHSFQHEALPTMTKPFIAETSLGRIMQPPLVLKQYRPVRPQTDWLFGKPPEHEFRSLAVEGSPVQVPFLKSHDPLNNPRVKVIVLFGPRHSGQDELGVWFDKLNVPLHQRLSGMLSEMFLYPLSLNAYTEAKALFIRSLGEEVNLRLQNHPGAQPRTEKDRLDSDFVWKSRQTLQKEHVAFLEKMKMYKLARDKGIHQAEPTMPGNVEPPAFASSFPNGHIFADKDGEPAQVIRLQYVIDVHERRDKSMLHLDVNLLSRLLSDFNGAHSGLNVDMQFIFTTRPVKALARSSFKRAPLEMPSFLKSEWHYLWDLRILRDYLYVLDAEVRAIHPGLTTMVDWDEVWDHPEGIGRRLSNFLGLSIRSAPASTTVAAALKSLEAPVVSSTTPLITYFTHHKNYFPELSPAPVAITEGAVNDGSASPLQLDTAFSDWITKNGGRNVYERQNKGNYDNLNWYEGVATDELFISVFDDGASQLKHLSRTRTKKAINEQLIAFERRGMDWLRILHSKKSTPTFSKSPEKRALTMLNQASRSANVTIALQMLQFPTTPSQDANVNTPVTVDCTDPSLQFLIFDGFFNLSRLPDVAFTERVDSAKQLPIVDQCSLAGSFELTAQFHALARTLSVALLTGRMLIVPEIPNTITSLLDLKQISQCSLADVGEKLERYTHTHKLIENQPILKHRVDAYYLASDDDKPLSTDPFDIRQKSVKYHADQYSMHWLLYHTSQQATGNTKSRPLFTPRNAGIQDYISSLNHFLVRPSAEFAQYKAAEDAKLKSTVRIAINIPLQSGNGTTLSIHALSDTVLRNIHHWGLGASGSSSIPYDLLVSSSCSRNSVLGSGSTGRGDGNSMGTGSERGREYIRHAETFAHFELMKKDIDATDATQARPRDIMKVPVDTLNELLENLLDAREILTGKDAFKPAAIVRARRNTVIYPHFLDGKPWSNPHQLLLADIFIDVLRNAEADLFISSHVHEEGLFIAELRHARMLHSQAAASMAEFPLKSIPSPWGLTVPRPILTPHFFDIHAVNYLDAFQRNEELSWELAIFMSMYDIKYNDPPKKAGATNEKLAVPALWTANGNPFLTVPPTLLNTVPPTPPLVEKKVFSNKVRFVFVAGMEGVGHHFFDNVLGATRQFNTTETAVIARKTATQNAPLQQKDKSPQSLISMRHTGRVVSDQLHLDGHLSNFAYATFTHDSLVAYERAKRQLGIRLKWLHDVMGTVIHRQEPINAPAVFFLNMLNAGDGMQSYPNADGVDRSMHHPDLPLLARLFESHGSDLRVLSLVRSPGSAFASTIRRGHGDGVKENKGTDLNLLFQARILHDNLGCLEADMRGIDPKFHLRIELDHLVKNPHANAKLISEFTGLHETTLLNAILKVSSGFFVKPSTSWKLQFSPLQLQLTRDHFSHVASLGLSDGVLYTDGIANWQGETAYSRIRAAHKVYADLADANGSTRPELPAPTLDKLDSDVVNSVCTPITSLQTMRNQAERQTLPVRVFINSLQGSGAEFLRYVLEQASGLMTSSTDINSLSPWPSSTIKPSSMIEHLLSWSAAGQTLAVSNVTCITCQFEHTWNGDALYKPNFRLEPVDASKYLESDVKRAKLTKVQYDEEMALKARAPSRPTPDLPFPMPPKHAFFPKPQPLYSAPVGGKILLLRNPLHIAFSLAFHWCKEHPFFLNADRLTVLDDRIEEWTRRAIEFVREHAMKEAMRIVADEYTKFMHSEGFALKDADADPSKRFKAAEFNEKHGGNTYLIQYETLESNPIETIQQTLDFLGVKSKPITWACVSEVLKQLQEANPTPTSRGRSTNSLPLFAHSLLASSNAFTQQFPWEWHVVLPKREFLEFETRLKPFIVHFGYQSSFELIKLEAAARWDDEVSWNRPRSRDDINAQEKLNSERAKQIAEMKAMLASMDKPQPIIPKESLPLLILQSHQQTSQ